MSSAYGGWHAVMWDQGMMVDLVYVGDGNKGAFDINDDSQIVGAWRASPTSSLAAALLLENGNVTNIGTLGGNAAHANAINEMGQIVGQSRTEALENHAFIWHEVEMIDLGSLGGTYSEAFDINIYGQVVGWSAVALSDSSAFGPNALWPRNFKTITRSTDWHAFLWVDDQMIDLGIEGFSYAFAINDLGQVVGYSAPSLADMIDNVLTFYENCVEQGTLIGVGPGKSAENRLNALRNMIETARDLAEVDVAGAREQLISVYERCDGLPDPPEFVEGPAIAELHSMINDLHLDVLW